MQEARRKPEGLIAWHFRHFAFLRVFYSSEGESKTSGTYEMELFCGISQHNGHLTILTWKNLIQYKNSLEYKVGCFSHFSYVYIIN